MLSKKPYKGCRDLFPELKRKQLYLFDIMRKTASEFGYEAYDGPMLEEVDLYLAKSGEELINEQIYSFTDRGERLVAIRPEMTPTVARMVAQVHREIPKPIRWYSIPNLMRYERPQKGRLREHWQFNCDIFGAPTSLGEIEILELIVTLFNNFGANQEHFEIMLNDRRVVDALFKQAMGLDEATSLKLYKIIDRSKKISAEKLQTEINETINSTEARVIFNDYLKLDSFETLFELIKKHQLEATISEFNLFYQYCQSSALTNYIKYDPTVVRGLDYYTGIVFEAFDKHPDNRRALCGGGAYANLLQIFKEPPLAGIGFGLGDVTLVDFLEVHKLMPDFSKNPLDILICYQGELASYKLANRLAHQLRSHGLKVELNLDSIKINKAFTLANKKNAPKLAVIAEDEVKLNQVMLKDLVKQTSQHFSLDQIDQIISDIKN